MDTMPSQITSLTIVNSTVYSDADQRKQQSAASLAFVRGIQMASNAENIFIWLRHHDLEDVSIVAFRCLQQHFTMHVFSMEI